ncbi:MAG: MBL fold metallo-hydrolase [Lachnospiraceae bacterium]|nr:MBL fold metallo-hydrolase [Candidatus Fimimorpha excrementavium]
MRFVSIASGSSGNCTYIGSENSHILVDAGISCKRITDSLKELDVKPQELNGIFITHEHSDHIQGVRVMAKKYGIPIYGTKNTLQKIREYDKKKEIDEALYCPLQPDILVQVGDLEVNPFSSSHDAVDPVVYRIESGTGENKKAVAVVTDLGVYSQYTINHLIGLDAILLEANHDLKMLETGPYPYYLKRRIMGNYGHLSNEASGQLLNELLHDGMKSIVLGHLSKENNYEALAYETVCLEVTMSEKPYKAADFPISVAKRDTMSDIIYL